MMQDVFDHSSLVWTYIESQRADHPHLDFKTYYQDLSHALQQAFDIDMSFDGIKSSDGKAFFMMLFGGAVRSYLQITSRDGVLEAGLLEMKIEQLGATGKKINQHRSRIYELKQQSIEAHLELLNDAFPQIWKPIRQSVTRDELKQFGFDREPPNISDYWDEM
jgi:hypothetical protein